MSYIRHRGLLPVAVFIAALGAQLCEGQAVPALPGSTPPSVAPGTPAGSYALSDLETIDLYSGKVNFVVPIHDIQGRGSAGYRMTVPVQRGWTIEEVPVAGKSPEPFPMSMETPDIIYATLPSEPDYAVEPYQPGYMVAREVATGVPCAAPNNTVYYGGYTLTKVVFIEPDGTETEFVDQLYGGAPQPTPSNSCNTTNQGQGASRGTLFVAVDGSAKTFIASTTISDYTWVQPREFQIGGMLFFPDGTRYTLAGGQVTDIYDPKGNYTQILLNNCLLYTSGDLDRAGVPAVLLPYGLIAGQKLKQTPADLDPIPVD